MKAAFLSSSLISSKGSAGPVTRALPPKELVSKSKRAEAIYNGPGQIHKVSDRQRFVQEPVVSPAPTPSPLPLKAEAPVENLKEHTDSMKKDRLGRVRMSIRMTPEQHLKLKLLSAHSKMSAQTIIENALDEYVQRNNNDLIPSNCACVQDKMFR